MSTYSGDDWKLYYLQTRELLKAFTQSDICANDTQAVIEQDNNATATGASAVPPQVG